VATYIGVAVYVVLYAGYSLHEKLYEKRTNHFAPIFEIDFESDAVWKPGEGDAIRQQEKDQEKGKLTG